jgi:malonyl-CoA/methylmalonyl-CoA synthetase
LIISGGYNVYPKEIEALLEEIGGIIDAAVVGLPHRDLGEAVTAVVIVRPGHSLDEASIQAYLKEHLAPYKVPKRVLLVEELPRNTMGKVQKNALRERYRGLYADS